MHSSRLNNFISRSFKVAVKGSKFKFWEFISKLLNDEQFMKVSLSKYSKFPRKKEASFKDLQLQKAPFWVDYLNVIKQFIVNK